MTSENAAPAEMPGVEEEQIARIIRDAGIDEYAAARAILALFAPILAEKEGEIEKLDGERAIYFDMSAKAEARALAAEAERDDFMRVAASRGQEIERLKEMRKRLDHRIHCQRKANRDNWEIVESRRKWLGSQTVQRAWMLQRDRRLAAEAALAGERERCALIAENETIHPLGEQIAAALRAQGE